MNQSRSPHPEDELHPTQLDDVPTDTPAFTRERAGVRIITESHFAFGWVRLVLLADEKSQLVSAVAYTLAVGAGAGAAFADRAIGLAPLPAVGSGAVVWLTLTALLTWARRTAAKAAAKPVKRRRSR